GEISRFCAGVAGQVYSGRVLRFFGEALRQAGILILGSTMVIWGLVFILGLQCGIEGAYFNRSVGAPAYAGVFAAWCDLREVIPYAFGYMMAAKVGTGIVAELGSMRISDEIDALEVMGFDSKLYLGATRLLGMWMVLPFIYLISIGVGFMGSYVTVVKQIGEVSAGGYIQLFWQFQNPLHLQYSLIAPMAMAPLIIRAGSRYQVHALFTDASQLVKGDLLEVGGRPVGTVQKISLTDHNQADLLLNITASDVKPLHQGTLLTVRPVGQSGVANRY